MAENFDSVLSTPRRVKNRGEKLYAPPVQSSKVPVSLQTRRVKFENFDLERIFSSKLYTNGAKSFCNVFFTRFGHPATKNSVSVLSTGV